MIIQILQIPYLLIIIYLRNKAMNPDPIDATISLPSPAVSEIELI
jgi:hypothetical protein